MGIIKHSAERNFTAAMWPIKMRLWEKHEFGKLFGFADNDRMRMHMAGKQLLLLLSIRWTFAESQSLSLCWTLFGVFFFVCLRRIGWTMSKGEKWSSSKWYMRQAEYSQLLLIYDSFRGKLRISMKWTLKRCNFVQNSVIIAFAVIAGNTYHFRLKLTFFLEYSAWKAKGILTISSNKLHSISAPIRPMTINQNSRRAY